MNKIIPTVGRKVYYRPSTDPHDDDAEMLTHKVDGVIQPLDATVIAVYADDVINLSIFDIHGHIFSRRNVKLIQAGERAPSMGRYAEWMPYQIGQAKKDDPLTGGSVSGSTSVLHAKLVDYDEAMAFFDKIGTPPGTLMERLKFYFFEVEQKQTEPSPAAKQPPVDNAHVADGCEKFDQMPSPMAAYSTTDLLNTYEELAKFGDDGVGILDRFGARVPATKTDIRTELVRRGELPVHEVVPNDPPRPMLHYGIDDLREAWDEPFSTVLMGDGKPFDKTAIHTELCYRGDEYKQPRYVASPLAPKTKSA